MYAWRAAQFPRKEVDMRSAIVSFIMVVVMAGAVTAQEWERREEVDPINDSIFRYADLATDIMSEATSGGMVGEIHVECFLIAFTDIRVLSIDGYGYKFGFQDITVRWDGDEPEIQQAWSRGDNELSMSFGLDYESKYEFITNLAYKDRLAIRADDARGAAVTHVFDIGNADTTETMIWVMEKCERLTLTDERGGAILTNDDIPQDLYVRLTKQEMYVIGLVGLFVVGLIVARRYRNRPY